MKTVARVGAIVAMMVLLAVAAQAGDYYAGVAGGTFNANDQGISNASGTTVDGISTARGYNVGAVAGYEFAALPVRVEVEGSYRSAAINGIDIGIHTESASGTIIVKSVLANSWYQLPSIFTITPYVGGGVGMAKVEQENVAITYTRFSGATPQTSRSGSGLAWQLGGGINYPLTKNLVADVGYRYFVTSDYSAEIGAQTITYRGLGTHNTTFGLRWSFR